MKDKSVISRVAIEALLLAVLAELPGCHSGTKDVSWEITPIEPRAAIPSPDDPNSTEKYSIKLTAAPSDSPWGSSVQWICDRGHCVPQDALETTYYAPSALGDGEDLVQLEITRRDKKKYVGRSVSVVLITRPEDLQANHQENTDHTTSKPGPASTAGKPTVEISQPGEFSNAGGPFTSTEIKGTVRNVSGNYSDYKVVLYARTNLWYVQPTAAEPETDVDEHGNWEASIHTGMQYAAILVRTGVGSELPAQLTVLPLPGDMVLALYKTREATDIK